jgi:phosphoglucomutase
MSSTVDALAGKLLPPSLLIDVAALTAAYFERPDADVAEQRVAFGTSGHRGSALNRTFNEWHVLAISQAICEYRQAQGTDGPLFIGIDTHALSRPAFVTALEVFAANGVTAMIAEHDEFTPTPAISHAILTYNRQRAMGSSNSGLADGIVITPSHNPPADGGYKYNPPNGGPADQTVTSWIETRANELLRSGLQAVRRIPIERALSAPTTHRFDFLNHYVADLGSVIDLPLIAAAGIRIGVDPLGGAGVNYWGAIAERYKLNLTVVNDSVDPTFAFMTADWDGRIRMDPSSSYAMQPLIGLKDGFDIAVACDTDHDRHGIVAPSAGLMPSNNFLAVAIDYLFRNRPQWPESSAIGKTVVSSQLIDRVATRLGRTLYEVPVGFKWFVDGLLDGSLGFGGEESAGATFLRRDGAVWTTDKDGFAPALLAAEMTARQGRDPGELYRELTRALGEPHSNRVEAAATPAQKKKLSKLAPEQIASTELAGEKIECVLSRAPGNQAPIGGLKICTANGWFAARPSGTENIYKIYAESFRDEHHLRRIIDEAQAVVDAAIAD